MNSARSHAPWTTNQLAAVRRNDPMAVKRLLREFRPMMARDIRRLCPWQVRSSGAATVQAWVDDRLQDVLERLWRSDVLLRWDPARGPLGSYLRLIARSEVKSSLRIELRKLSVTDLYAEPPSLGVDLSFERCLQAESHAHLVQRIRARLSEEDEQLFLLFCDPAELQMEEIASRLGKSGSLDGLYKSKERLKRRIKKMVLGDPHEAEARG